MFIIIRKINIIIFVAVLCLIFLSIGFCGRTVTTSTPADNNILVIDAGHHK